MDTEPDFSIITPSYNYARYVKECIESVKTRKGLHLNTLSRTLGPRTAPWISCTPTLT